MNEKLSVKTGDLCMTYGVAEDQAVENVRLPLAFARYFILAHDMAAKDNVNLHVAAQNAARLIKRIGFTQNGDRATLNLDHLEGVLNDPERDSTGTIQLLEKLADLRIKIIAVLKEIFGLDRLQTNTSTIKLLRDDSERREFVFGYLDYVMSRLTSSVLLGGREEPTIRSATMDTLPKKLRDAGLEQVATAEYAYPHVQAAFALDFVRNGGKYVAPEGEKTKGELHQIEVLRDLTEAIVQQIMREKDQAGQASGRYLSSLQRGVASLVADDNDRVITDRWDVSSNLMGGGFRDGQMKKIDPYYSLSPGNGNSFQIPMFPSPEVKIDSLELALKVSGTGVIPEGAKKLIRRDLHPVLQRLFLPSLASRRERVLLRSRVRDTRFQPFVEWLDRGGEEAVSVPRGDLMLMGKMLQALAQEVEEGVKSIMAQP